MSSDGGGSSSSSGGDGGSSATSIDARGHKEVDIQSTQQLWGALVPIVVLGLAYLAAFLYFRRRAAVRDVYDPKRRRLAALAQGRGHPTIRGLPEAWKERSPSLTPTPLPPPDVPASPWGWFLDLWRISDAAIITYTGADAYMFLRFLRVGYWVALASTLFGIVVLLPVHVHGGNGMSKLEKLSLANVADKSQLLWVHFAFAYLFTGLALWLLLEEYKVYSDMRQRYLRAPTVQNYSILVRDVPQEVDCRTLRPYLESILGEEITAIHPVNGHRCRRYEYWLGRKEAATVKLTRALEEEAATRQRPTHREPYRIKGTISLGVPLGPRVDTIHNLEDEVAHCNRNLELIRRETETTESLEGEVQAAVVTLDLVRVATAFKKLPFQEDIRYFTVKEAPPPKHLIWRNLAHTSRARRLRTGLVWAAVITLILGYTVPVGFASSLANLQGLVKTRAFRWLKPALDISPALTAFLQGFLPPLVVALFLALLPALLKFLSRLEGFASEAECENSALLKLFLFYVFDIVLAYTIAGSFLSKLQQLTQLIGQPADIVGLFATTLPSQSTFFINYILLGAFASLPMELLRLGPLAMTKLRRWVLQRRWGLWDELALLTEEVGFHVLYAFPLVVFLVLVTYAPVAPLLAPFALAYFALAYPVYLHQLTYVYQPTTHTGGSQYPTVFGCGCAALIFMQILLIGLMGVKRAATPSALLIPLLAATVAFAFDMHKSFCRVTEVATLESLAHTDLAEYGPTTREALAKAYAPLPDTGEGEELSMPTLVTWTDPYGVVAQGMVTEGQRAAIEAMNAAGGGPMPSKDEAVAGPSVEEAKESRLLPLMGEGPGAYGATGEAEAKWEDIRV